MPAFWGTAAADRIVGGAGADQIYGQAGDDTLYGAAGDDWLNGGLGSDLMVGGLGNDVYYVAAAGDGVVERAGEGTDAVLAWISYQLTANVEHLTLSGTADLFGTGNALNNTILGNAGNNVLNGGGGADTLIGAKGNDVYDVDSAGDRVQESANEGYDRVRASVSFALGANLEELNLTGTAAINGTGNALANTIVGNAGNNLLNGAAGDDVLIGGKGDDIYYVGAAGDRVVERAGEGFDQVHAWVGHQLAADVEALTLEGTAAINGFGNALNNLIIGNAANNVLDGGAGDDTLVGGQGDDVYDVDSSGDRVQESMNGGHDRVQTSRDDYELPANVEDLTLTGNSLFQLGYGNSLDNVITGGAGRDDISGRAGNDVLFGNGGNDFLFGGSGDNTLAGGAGDDTYTIESSGDRVQELAGEGEDTVHASVTFALGANIENLFLEGWEDIDGFGNGLDNTIRGNLEANVLNGKAGNDILIGLKGDDVYDVDSAGDQVREATNEGYDRVRSSVSFTLGANVEELNLTGTAAINGTGNALANTIVGNAAANVLTGGSGDDTLDGKAGNDRLVGGIGNDIYMVDSANDQVVELAGEGIDRVRASVSHTLVANAEDLNLTGAGAINGTGNALANTIIGNAGANVLTGGAGDDMLLGDAGNDALYGGSGRDRLYGGTGSNTLGGGIGDDIYVTDNDLHIYDPWNLDTLVERAGEGTDLVIASHAYALADNIENLILVGVEDGEAIGNQLSNSITGNSGDNVLDGREGNDRLAGGDGDDTYVVDTVGDIVIENSNSGIDTIRSQFNYVLGANIENLVLEVPRSFDPAHGTGNELNNTIWGSDGDDILDGRGGNDTLIGGAGLNTYLVDSAGDIVVEGDSVFSAGVVRATVSYALGANVGSLILLGSANLNGTGNATDNRIEGNSGNNILRGEGGIDYLTGGLGRDQVYGGDGDDYIYIDKMHIMAGEIYDGGSGYDGIELNFGLSNAFIDISGLRIDSIESITSLYQVTKMTMAQAAQFSELDAYGLQLADGGVLDLTANPNVSVGWFILSNQGTTLNLTGRTNPSVVDGGAGADTILGGTYSNQITGGGGDDYIVSAGDSNSSLEGGSGNDRIDASQGNDSFVNGNDGADIIDGRAGDDALSGDAGNDRLIGGGGDDRLDGGLGNDTMVGGAGHDSYTVDSLDDIVTELPGEGIDTVLSSLSYALGADLENLILSGTSMIDGTGNQLDNTLEGNAAANVLSGGSGRDTLLGYAGNDTLIGGGGGDSFAYSGSRNQGVDTIADFSSAEGDKLLFQGLLHGTFNYLGTASFTGSGISQARFAAGQLLVDTDGDGIANITANLTGITAASQIHASDFVFT